MYVYMYECVYVCMYIHMHVCVYVCMCVMYVSTHTCMCVYIYIYIFIAALIFLLEYFRITRAFCILPYCTVYIVRYL